MMANDIAIVCLANAGTSAEFVFRMVCCIFFAYIVVMLVNFTLASRRSRIAKTEKDEILESTMNYYTHSEPYATLEPYGVVHERIEIKNKHYF